MKAEEIKDIGILLGDIGATISRLSLKVYNSSSHLFTTLKESTYQSIHYRSLEDLLMNFLQEFIGKPLYPFIACLAIAGPLINGKVSITNISAWPYFDYEATSKNLNIPSFKILNNFEANGYGILSLDPSKIPKINFVEPIEGAPKAFIGSGTGLGEGLATKGMKSDGYTVIPGEGGHADFSARNEIEYELLKYVKKKFNLERVSVERCCSGPAIGIIYEFFLEYYKDKKISKLFEEKKGELSKISNEMIFDFALSSKDQICIETLKLFTAIYGSEAGNLCLKTLPYGGLYLMSGITTAIKDYLKKDPTFMENFLNKGRMGELLKKIPIYLIEDTIGITGVEYYVLKHLV